VVFPCLPGLLGPVVACDFHPFCPHAAIRDTLLVTQDCALDQLDFQLREAANSKWCRRFPWVDQTHLSAVIKAEVKRFPIMGDGLLCGSQLKDTLESLRLSSKALDAAERKPSFRGKSRFRKRSCRGPCSITRLGGYVWLRLPSNLLDPAGPGESGEVQVNHYPDCTKVGQTVVVPETPGGHPSQSPNHPVLVYTGLGKVSAGGMASEQKCLLHDGQCSSRLEGAPQSNMSASGQSLFAILGQLIPLQPL
jgi:hypothetical protein